MKDNYPNRGKSQFANALFNKPSLTVPNKGLRVREAIERYKTGTLEEKSLAYYYDAYQFDGEEAPPDFTRMTKIEQLRLLSEKRKEVQDFKDQFPNAINRNLDGTFDTETVPEPNP